MDVVSLLRIHSHSRLHCDPVPFKKSRSECLGKCYDGGRGGSRVGVLRSLELDMRALGGVEEQVLVVSSLLEQLCTQRVARLPIIEVVELL